MRLGDAGSRKTIAVGTIRRGLGHADVVEPASVPKCDCAACVDPELQGFEVFRGRLLGQEALERLVELLDLAAGLRVVGA